MNERKRDEQTNKLVAATAGKKQEIGTKHKASPCAKVAKAQLLQGAVSRLAARGDGTADVELHTRPMRRAFLGRNFAASI